MNVHGLLLTACAAVSAAPFSFSGTVRDEGGAPVAGVEVVLQGYAGSALSDAQGAFQLTGDDSKLSAGRSTGKAGIRRSFLTNTVEWADAGEGATLDAYRTDGTPLALDLPFVEGRATLPRHAGMVLLLRVKRNGALVADFKGAGTAAPRSLAGAGVLRFARSGFAPDTLSVDALQKTGLSKSLVASDPWIPTTLRKSGTMVRIIAANKVFAMGSNNVWDEFDIPESPRHSVKLTRDFWMDTVETTQALYGSIMKAGYGSEYTGSIDWNANFGLGPNYPAYGATAGGAILYCNARSKQEGLDTVYTYTSRDGSSSHASLTGVVADLTKSGYRLPTEAEWEYAARGGTTADFPWGEMSLETASISDAMSANAVWQGNALDLEGTPQYGTHEVGTRIPNAYGLYDMHGNVAEWCWDVMDFNGYKAGQVVDPMTAPDPEMATGDMHDLAKRGGHWANSPNFLRSSNRTFEAKVYFSYNEGFRTVRRAD